MFQIEPFASLVNTVRSTVPRLLLNRHAVGPFEKVPLRRGDHVELGDLEDTVRRFAELLGWNDEIEELMRSQETLVGSIFSNRPLKSFLQVMQVSVWVLLLNKRHLFVKSKGKVGKTEQKKGSGAIIHISPSPEILMGHNIFFFLVKTKLGEFPFNYL